MASLREMKEAAHRNTLKCRSIESIVTSDKFERMWGESKKIQKMEAEHIIWKGNKGQLMKWMSDHPSLELGERSLIYLRARAKKIRVKNYSRLSKPELIREIEYKEKIDEK